MTSPLTSDFLRPARLRAEQERLFVSYVNREVRHFSDHYGRAVEQLEMKELSDLARLAITEPESLADPIAMVLRPDRERLLRSGWFTQLRLRGAELLGSTEAWGRARIDPVYKPVQWTVDDGMLVASSAADAERLAEFGRRWLEAAGVRASDTLVSFVAPGPTLAYRELEAGARRAGLSALFLPAVPSVIELVQLRPDVIAGAPDDLLRLLMGARGRGADLQTLRTVLAVGSPLGARDRRLLSELVPRAVVLQAWAPPGVRSLWFECHGVTGLHTQPGAELVEVVVPPDDRPAERGQYGDLLWSSIGWKGTVALRLRTGLLGGLDTSVCSACGRGSARIRVPDFIEILDDSADLADWQVELGSGPDGRDELLVFVALSGRSSDRRARAVVEALADRMAAAGEQAQFVVESPDELAARIAEAGDARLVDTR